MNDEHVIPSSTLMPLPFGLMLPLAQLQLGFLLALAHWSGAMWTLQQTQYERFAAFLGGGAPIDA